jgi:hypothetical protein
MQKQKKWLAVRLPTTGLDPPAPRLRRGTGLCLFD